MTKLEQLTPLNCRFGPSEKMQLCPSCLCLGRKTTYQQHHHLVRIELWVDGPHPSPDSGFNTSTTSHQSIPSGIKLHPSGISRAIRRGTTTTCRLWSQVTGIVLERLMAMASEANMQFRKIIRVSLQLSLSQHSYPSGQLSVSEPDWKGSRSFSFRRVTASLRTLLKKRIFAIC